MTGVEAARQPTTGTGFALRDPWPWPAFARLGRIGDELGYAAVFLPEIRGRDALAALAALAGETSQVLLGTGIVPMASRRPTLTAMAAATVHERSDGRAILGLGTGGAAAGALERLEEQVREIRGFLDEAVARDGDGEGDVDGGRLALTRPVPIWIAALGPRAVALAGRIADGVLLNWCSPERVALAREQVVSAAGDAGRDPGAISIAAYVRAAVSDDPAGGAGAREALVAAASEYAALPAYRRQFEAMGLGPAARAASEPAGEAGARLDSVSPLIDLVCLSGDARGARARLDEYRRAGCDLPVVYPVPFSPDAEASVVGTLSALAPR
jgi:alkanesulfonate monooxygenase SsuD/methylene tetrahydromethanopterin reductase-like flavin-dependent oxidoreductase (luciferase family)